jgi:hypothetical protein
LALSRHCCPCVDPVPCDDRFSLENESLRVDPRLCDVHPFDDP